MGNPLASACCNPPPSCSRCEKGRGSAGRQGWGQSRRNTCVGMGQLAGVLKLTAFGSQVIEDILVRKSLDSIADEVAQVINGSNIIVWVAVRRPKLKLVLATRMGKQERLLSQNLKVQALTSESDSCYYNWRRISWCCLASSSWRLGRAPLTSSLCSSFPIYPSGGDRGKEGQNLQSGHIFWSLFPDPHC